jgi:hypothetical protein
LVKAHLLKGQTYLLKIKSFELDPPKILIKPDLLVGPLGPTLKKPDSTLEDDAYISPL